MKKLLLLLFIIIPFLMISYQCMAADKWSKQDVTLEIAKGIIHAIDWRQTRYIAKNPDKYYEKYNLSLGKHPSTKKVDIYFLTTQILHPVIIHYLPKKWRPYWQGVSIGISSFCVGRNISIGIGIQW